MRGFEIFQKPSYREISPMQDRPMRGPPVLSIPNMNVCNTNLAYIRRNNMLKLFYYGF